MDAFTALRLIATLEFKPFTEADFDCYSGVQTEDPMIAYSEDYAVILDGTTVGFIGEDSWHNFYINLEFEG